MSVLSGRHALVTGAGRGIGAAIAARLAADGAVLTLMGRTKASLDETAATIGANAHVVVCDVTDTQAFGIALSEMARVDILINNAGQAVSAPVMRTTDEIWARMLAVNLTAPFTCTRAVLPGMLTAGWGRVVTVASTAALRGYPYVAAYAAAKHGVLGFTRSLALEVATKGVTVSIANIVQRTGRSEAEARETLAALNPQRRFITPADVAHAVSSLCAPSADALTGLALPVSGGEVM